MTENSKYMLKDSVIPMLLGDSFAAQFLALRLYLRCGVVSYICDTKKSLFSLINPAVRYFPLFCSQNCNNALNSLSYAAANSDYLPILVPCSHLYADFVENNREFLESRFIISDRSSVFSCPPIAGLL